MTDVELTRALERCEVPNEGFAHPSHLRVAWVYLTESRSVEEATERMAASLRRFAASVKARTAAACSGAPSPNFNAKAPLPRICSAIDRRRASGAGNVGPKRTAPRHK